MLFRWRKGPAKPDEAVELVLARDAKRITRLEIEVEELRTLIEATWSRQRRVEGAVHGMRGGGRPAANRGSDESFDEFRDRMLREGRVRGVPTGENNREE